MTVIDFISKDKKLLKKIMDVLDFYADPETYFAIGYLGDKPCGDFIKDFSETQIGYKPGQKSRKILKQIVTAYNSDCTATVQEPSSKSPDGDFS